MANVMNFPDINQIKDEASLWVVKLHGFTYKTGESIPPEQAAALRTWLAQSERHHEAFLTMLSGWDAMTMLEDLADILPLTDSLCDKEYDALSQQAGGQQAVAPQSWGWVSGLSVMGASLREAFASKLALSGMAASALALAMVLIIGPQVSFHLSPQETRYITRIGEQAAYTLNDGSVLTLNTDTEVEIDYRQDQRSIILHRGEAGFDVAKNKQRPFVVYAGEGMVWAVGTAFNVNYRESYVDVVVSEGKVKVFSDIAKIDSASLPLINTIKTSGGIDAVDDAIDTAAMGFGPQSNVAHDVVLTAGEGVQYKDAIMVKQALEAQVLDKKLAWQTGSLFFQGETLEQAMVEIARYTDQHLVIVDASIRNTRVGGRFKTDDINGLLRSLAEGLNIKMEKGEGSQLLFSAK